MTTEIGNEDDRKNDSSSKVAEQRENLLISCFLLVAFALPSPLGASATLTKLTVNKDTK